ncbi:hypothetical protein ACFQZX_00265 [Mucilaginibacter litoreus]|uniref:ApeA N-terminal domain-containing protein n=1 Tax=Mucilaginibacter litoreus TaxID=1048221 RepID=A0ABW3AMF1_9SPHI
MDTDNLILELVEKHIGSLDLHEEYVTVAELKSVKVNGISKSVDINTALISPRLFKKIKPPHVNPFVNTTGASYQEDWAYSPSFWLYLSASPGLKKAETLVVSWESANKTTLLPDQGFLKTFDLIPKFAGDQTLWHDLSRPIYDVVVNQPVSGYSFPERTEAYVKIRSEYFRDYLLMRKKSAVRILTIKTTVIIDDGVAALLNGNEYFVGESGQYEVRIRKPFDKDGSAYLEINGFQLLFDPTLKSDTNETGPVGHTWKGIEGIVDGWRARHEMFGKFIYVSDDVLGRFESDDDYEVYPDSGAVSYLGQWSITHCERVGRNAIRIEVKKLYESAPGEEIDYWNKFSIDPKEVKAGENISEKAKSLIRKYFLFGRILANLINRSNSYNYKASDIISLDEEQINYAGWTEFPDYKLVSNHVPARGFSRDHFLTRCKYLYQLLGENLKESKIRQVINDLGFPETELVGFKGLKLLELLIKYYQVAHESGLDIKNAQAEIVERVVERKDYFPLKDLNILAAIRNLGSHKGGDIKTKIQPLLNALGIEAGSISNNYGAATDLLYDRLTQLFADLNSWLGEI